jgi:hypothetical protein
MFHYCDNEGKESFEKEDPVKMPWHILYILKYAASQRCHNHDILAPGKKLEQG